MSNELDYWAECFEKTKYEMLQVNFETIKSHVRKMKAANMRERTITNHYQVLIQFGKWCNVPFDALTETEILDYIDWLDKQTYTPRYTLNKPKKGSEKKYSDGTKYVKLATIKAFLKNINKDAAATIKVKPSHTKKLPEDLLTKEDIEALLDNCPNSRDRALIATLYESGMRRGELFSVKLKSVQFDEKGTVITIPDGKTGARRIRLVFATSFLHAWIEVHPCKQNRDAILFCSLREPFPRLTDAGLRDQLTKIAGKAGIKKRVNAHSFRHARATHLAEHLTEQQLKKYLGWTEGSNMASIYVHLSGKDIDNAILKMNGIQIDDTHTDGLKVGKCPRCHEINPENSIFCYKCGLPLKLEAATSVENIKTDYMQFADLEEIREMKDALKQELEEISKLKEMMLKAGK